MHPEVVQGPGEDPERLPVEQEVGLADLKSGMTLEIVGRRSQPGQNAAPAGTVREVVS